MTDRIFEEIGDKGIDSPVGRDVKPHWIPSPNSRDLLERYSDLSAVKPRRNLIGATGSLGLPPKEFLKKPGEAPLWDLTPPEEPFFPKLLARAPFHALIDTGESLTEFKEERLPIKIISNIGRSLLFDHLNLDLPLSAYHDVAAVCGARAAMALWRHEGPDIQQAAATMIINRRYDVAQTHIAGTWTIAGAELAHLRDRVMSAFDALEARADAAIEALDSSSNSKHI